MQNTLIFSLLGFIAAQNVVILNAEVRGTLQMCADPACSGKVSGPDFNTFLGDNVTFQWNTMIGCGDFCSVNLLGATQSIDGTLRNLNYTVTTSNQQTSVIQLFSFVPGNNQTITVSGNVKFTGVEQVQVASNKQYASPKVGNPNDYNPSIVATQNSDGNYQVTIGNTQGQSLIIYLLNENRDTRLYTDQSDGSQPSWPQFDTSTNILQLKASDVQSNCQFTPPLTFTCQFEIATISNSKTENQVFFQLQVNVNSVSKAIQPNFNILQKQRLGLVNLKTYQIGSQIKICPDIVCASYMNYENLTEVNAQSNIYILHQITDIGFQNLYFSYGMVYVYYDDVATMGQVSVFESGPGYVVYVTKIDSPAQNITLSVQGVLSNPKSSSRMLTTETQQQVSYKLRSSLKLTLKNQCKNKSNYCPNNQTNIATPLNSTKIITSLKNSTNQTNSNKPKNTTKSQNTTIIKNTSQVNSTKTGNSSTIKASNTTSTSIKTNTTSASSNSSKVQFISVTVFVTSQKQSKSPLKSIKKSEKIYLNIKINNKAYSKMTLKKIKVYKGTVLLPTQSITQLSGIVKVTLSPNSSLSLKTLKITGEFTPTARVSTQVKIPLIR